MIPTQCPKCRCYWWKVEPSEEDGPAPLFNLDQFGEVINYYGRMICAQCAEPWMPLPDKPHLRVHPSIA